MAATGRPGHDRSAHRDDRADHPADGRRGPGPGRRARPDRDLEPRGGLAADRAPLGARLEGSGPDVRHQRRRPADGPLHLRRVDPGAHGRRRPHHPDQHDDHRPVLQPPDQPPGQRRHGAVRRRQLDRDGHDEHRQRRHHQLRSRHQPAHLAAGHEPGPLVRDRHHPARRLDLHPGRRRGLGPGRALDPRERGPAAAVRHPGASTGGTPATSCCPTAASSASTSAARCTTSTPGSPVSPWRACCRPTATASGPRP